MRLIDRIRARRRFARIATAGAFCGGLALVVIAGNPFASTMLVAAAIATIAYHVPKMLERRLMAHLRETRGALCPGCGYELFDRPGDLCPECGRRITIEQACAAWRTLARQWPGDAWGHVQRLCRHCGHDMGGYRICPRCQRKRGVR